MQYFVIWPDGNKFGPADLATLNQWIAENRINPDTQLESVVDGAQMRAGDLPGLNFPAAAPTPAEPVQPATPASPVDPVTPAAPVDPVQPSQPTNPVATPASYFVVGEGGQKFGPADVPTLTQWAAENRLTQTTELEDAVSGERVMASQVAGLIFPMAATGMSGYSGEMMEKTKRPTPSSHMADYPRGERYVDPEAGKKEFTTSIVLSVLGPLCCCFLPFIGLHYANKASLAGHPNAKTAKTVAFVCIAVSVIFSIIGVFMNLAAFQGLSGGGGLTP